MVGCHQCYRSAPGSFGCREGAQNIIVGVLFLSADVQCMAALGLRLGKPRAAFKTLPRIIRRDIRRGNITRCNRFLCYARGILVFDPGRDGFSIDVSGYRYGLDPVLCTADLHRQQLIVGVSNRSAEGGAGGFGGIELHAVGLLGTLGILGVEALLYLRHVRHPSDRGDFKNGGGRRRGSGGERRCGRLAGSRQKRRGRKGECRRQGLQHAYPTAGPQATPMRIKKARLHCSRALKVFVRGTLAQGAKSRSFPAHVKSS